ncbi:DUF4124 domain-containing protein [Ferribacterium limneticum]|uniref:DUF4124 domain-containing protein n=1 Tax=Ferribacterium limneticum TaxID=76259 RepID=UPI001CF8A7E0|nr:DUF4124 domain-containing protein [Ferribacterium limneticum]UCV21684.1 DUF4124 domain-containing protein [Ferribacterium limneticum]
MLRIFIVTFALISLPAPASAEIYKCRLANGKTEIANVPCPTGSGTVTVRPDEHVSEATRRAAEQDVERMRNYVEKREAVQRAEEAAEREERVASQRQQNTASRAPRQYGNTDECLRNIESMILEASQRAQMEAECRNLVSPQPVYAPVGVPVYPQRHHVHPLPAPAPKTEPPSAPKISVQPLKK